MEELKCASCGGTIKIDEELMIGVCEYCGTEQALSVEVIESIELKKKEHQAQAEAERRDKIKKKIKNISKIAIPLVILLIAFFIVLIALIIPNNKYKKANVFLNEKDYAKAIAIYEVLGNYKDSKVLYNQYRFYEIKAGDTVKFGNYIQSGSSYSGGTIKKELTWRVFAIENGKALLITDKIIDVKKHEEAFHEWENCPIRKWLNDDFINTAFSSDDQKRILSVNLRNYRNYDGETIFNDTIDRVFLLSDEELIALLPNKIDRISDSTKYANNKYILKNDRNKWSLRTSGFTYCFSVDNGGNIDDKYETEIGIRPAIWVKLDTPQ